jgi:hypothetical protein
MMGTRNGVTTRERNEKIQWLRKHREMTQYLSVVERPQAVRTLWLKHLMGK